MVKSSGHMVKRLKDNIQLPDTLPIRWFIYQIAMLNQF